MNTTLRFGAVSLLALMITACGGESNKEVVDPAPSVTANPEPTVSAGASIIRDDVPLERALPPLEPLDQRISFDEGGSDLSDAAIAELETVLASRQMEAGGAIILRGHTDSAGSDEANIRASQNRADAVHDWLVENGVSEARFTIIAMGEQNPEMPNANPDGSANEAGRAYNRRVMLSIMLPPELEKQRQEQPQTLVEQVTAQE